jgi:hypothetical protein|tara:strand:+ start:423 stop:743 length:321 start_codon:yes stop_codon:yes gene_type:complete
MKRYLYFGEATVETTGESCMFSVDSFLGMTPASATATDMRFLSRNGESSDDNVRVTHTGHTPKAFMTEIVKFMQANQKNPFLIIADKTNPTAVSSMVASVNVATEA